MDVGKSLNPAIDIGQVCDHTNNNNVALVKVSFYKLNDLYEQRLKERLFKELDYLR